MPNYTYDPVTQFTNWNSPVGGSPSGGFNNLIAPSGNLYTSSAGERTSETYLPPEKQQAFATLNQFLQDPLQNIAGRMGPLLRSLIPSEQASRQGLMDQYRRAGGLRSGAFAQGARQLEGDIFGRRAETTLRGALGALGPIMGGYQTALTGIPALERSQQRTQGLSEFGGRGGGGGGGGGGAGDFGFSPEIQRIRDRQEALEDEERRRLARLPGTAYGSPDYDTWGGFGGMGGGTAVGSTYYDPASAFDYSGGEGYWDGGGGGDYNDYGGLMDMGY